MTTKKLDNATSVLIPRAQNQKGNQMIGTTHQASEKKGWLKIQKKVESNIVPITETVKIILQSFKVNIKAFREFWQSKSQTTDFSCYAMEWAR